MIETHERTEAGSALRADATVIATSMLLDASLILEGGPLDTTALATLFDAALALRDVGELPAGWAIDVFASRRSGRWGTLDDEGTARLRRLAELHRSTFADWTLADSRDLSAARHEVARAERVLVELDVLAGGLS